MKRTRNTELGGGVKKYIDLISGLPLVRALQNLGLSLASFQL